MIRFSELLSIVYSKAKSAFNLSVLMVIITTVFYRLNQVTKHRRSTDGLNGLLQTSSGAWASRPFVTFPVKAFHPKCWQLEYTVLTKKVYRQDNSFQRMLAAFVRTLWHTDHQRLLTDCSR